MERTSSFYVGENSEKPEENVSESNSADGNIAQILRSIVVKEKVIISVPGLPSDNEVSQIVDMKEANLQNKYFQKSNIFKDPEPICQNLTLKKSVATVLTQYAKILEIMIRQNDLVFHIQINYQVFFYTFKEINETFEMCLKCNKCDHLIYICPNS